MSRLEFLISRGMRIEEDAIGLLETCDDAAFNSVLGLQGFVTKDAVEAIIARNGSGQSGQASVAMLQKRADFRITNWVPSSTKRGKIDSFVSYFRSRYKKLKKLLRQRVSDYPLIDSFEGAKNLFGKVRAIGLVADRKATRNGNVMITLEDETGVLNVIASKESRCFEKSRQVLFDEVLAIDGQMSKGFLMAHDFIWPDLPIRPQPKGTCNDVAIMYLSDLHVGSRFFLERQFKSLVSWLNGKGEQADLAGKIRYIIIAGDLVDGVGIYPRQENELVISDVYKQYSVLDEMLCEIPERIEIFAAPGNHDAVRRAEPQPMLPQEFFTRKVHMLTNPSWVEIEGLKHLVYHGTSMDSVIASLEQCDYAHPERAMTELMKRRHLSPIYGENLISPEDVDSLVVEDEPDVVHMGHLHKNAYFIYRGTALINSGTFQDQTEYQLKQGHVPSPCQVPVYECKTGKMQLLKFG